MRVRVDYDLCESNAVCMAIAPTVFLVDENDALQVLTDTPEESLRETVTHAVQSCPRAALALEN